MNGKGRTENTNKILSTERCENIRTMYTNKYKISFIIIIIIIIIIKAIELIDIGEERARINVALNLYVS